MAYEYTEEGCFKGKLLKDPPLPADDPEVEEYLEKYRKTGPKRRWLHYGCAVEELGRFSLANPTGAAKESAFVYHLHEQLSQPQPIPNNDGIGVAAHNDEDEPLFEARFVLVALVDEQIKRGLDRILIDYFGFQKLAPYFGNCESHYGRHSRIGLYGVCTTRYLAPRHQD